MQDFLNFIKQKNIELSGDKIEFISHFFNFLRDDNSSIFILKGHSQTGKTFLSTLLHKYFITKGVSSSYFYPTGRASRKFNFDNKSNISSTIHGVIYDWKNRQENVDEKYPIIVPLKDNIDEIDKLHIYFIDNAASISDMASQDKFVFGSGRLLYDILDYINIDNHKNKLVIVGDVTLLEPVNMNISPALNKEYIIEKFNIIPYEYTLKEQKRQINKGIFEISNMLCSAIERKDYNNLQIKGCDDVLILNDDVFIEKFLEINTSYKFTHEVIITSSNRMAIDYNRKIREKIGKDPNQLCISDKLILTKTAYIYGHTIYSGEFIYIDSLDPDQIVVSEEINNMKYIIIIRKANIIHYVTKHPTLLSVYLCESLLTMEENDLILEEYLAIDKYIQKNEKCDHKISLALKVKYGYAITCNKAHDGKWKHVFVDCETHHKNKVTQEYFQWLNTAVTRSSEMLYLKNVPNINLGMDLNKKEDEIIDYRILGENLINMIKNNINILSEYDIFLDKIAQNLYTLKFIKNNIATEINIFYKKDFSISAIQPINNNEDSLIIKEALSPMINKKIGQDYYNIIKLNNEVLDNIVEDIINKLNKANLHTEIKLFPYKIRFMINDNKEHVTLDLTYNKKNVITDRKFNCHDNIEMINKIKKILGI